MAVQQWTIFKLVGPSAELAGARLDEWSRTRRSDDPTCWTSDDWPATARRAATTFIDRWIEQAHEMPVAYFSRHVDHWSHGEQPLQHLGDSAARLLIPECDLWWYSLPDRGRLVRRNTRLLRADDFQETAWLAQRLIEAARAYDKLWSSSLLIVHRRPITASPSDDDLRAAAVIIPDWMKVNRQQAGA